MENLKTKSKRATVAVGSDALVRRSLSFQPYEIELMQEALNVMRHAELSKCPWEKQPDGGYYYTKNRRIRQIEFIERSITRQLSEPNT